MSGRSWSLLSTGRLGFEMVECVVAEAQVARYDTLLVRRLLATSRARWTHLMAQ